MQPQEYLTVPEVAAILRVHPVTVQKFCRTGKLQSERIGRVYRIPREGLDAFRKALRENAQLKIPEPEVEPELASLVTAWIHDMEHGARPCSPETVRTHRRHVHKYLMLVMEAAPNGRLTYREAFNERALGRVIARIPVSKFASRYNIYNAVMSCTRFLLVQGLMDKEVREAMKRHKPRRLLPPKRTVLNSLDEVNRLIEAVWQSEGLTRFEKARNAAAIGVMAFAGLRVSEVASLELSHVDLSTRIIFVHHGKGGKERIVGINHRLKDLLEEYLRVRPELDTSLLFPSASGGRLDRCYLNKCVRRTAKRAGLDVSAHGLRRSFATLASEAGRPLGLIQKALGHSSIATTELYLMSSQRTAAKAMQEW